MSKIVYPETDFIELSEFEKCDFFQQSLNKITDESGLLNSEPTHFKLFAPNLLR